MITTKVHALLDYIVGLFVMLMPWILGYADEVNNRYAVWIPFLLGLSSIVYSLCTRYEYSLAKLITMRTHLLLDMISGFLLLLSPWLFGFHEEIMVPMVIVGILEIGIAAMTERRPVQISHARSAHE